MIIKTTEAKQMCMDVLIKKGYSDTDAETIVDEYMDGQLRGRECHGLANLKKFAAKTPSKEKPIVKETDSFLHIDGQGVKAPIILRDNLDKLMEKARNSGIAMLGMHNAESYLMPGTYARQIAENKLIAIIMNYGGYPRIAPTGSIDPQFGVDPIAFGIPAKDFPIVVDMGTSKQVMGKVRLADKLGRKLEPGSAIDKNGNPTTDPKEAMAGALMSFGGHKGYCLTIAIEALTRCLFNVDYKKKAARGYLLICINPKAFNDDYQKSVQDMIYQIKNGRKSEGVEKIFVPGERSERIKQENLKKGYIEVPDIIIEEIRGI